MAAPIYVHTKELVISDAKKASSCIEDAISAMSKVDNAVSGWDLYIDAAADGFVFAKSESEVGACLSALRTKQTQLEKLISVMQTGTEKLEEADAGFKNEITDPNLWERLTNAVGRAIYSSTLGKIDTVIIGITCLSNLFSHDSSSQTEPITTQQRRLTKDKIDEVLDKFDWTRVEECQAEIDALIEKSSDQYELSIFLQELYLKKVRERYISQINPDHRYWGDYYNRYISEIEYYGCFTSSLSMSFAYVGVDILPSEICKINEMNTPGNPMNAYYGKVAEQNGFGYSYPSLGDGINNYLNDPNIYTPPIIQIDGSGGYYHYVVVVGQDSAGNLVIRDPAAGDMRTIPSSTHIYATYQFYRKE